MAAWKLIEKIDENNTEIHTFKTKRDLMDFADTLCPIVERDAKDKHAFIAIF